MSLTNDNPLLAFVDVYETQNSEGESFRAEGLIYNASEVKSEGCGSGKDYSVVYFDSEGSCCSEWRSVEEINVFSITPDGFYELHKLFLECEDSPFVSNLSY